MPLQMFPFAGVMLGRIKQQRSNNAFVAKLAEIQGSCAFGKGFVRPHGGTQCVFLLKNPNTKLCQRWYMLLIQCSFFNRFSVHFFCHFVSHPLFLLFYLFFGLLFPYSPSLSKSAISWKKNITAIFLFLHLVGLGEAHLQFQQCPCRNSTTSWLVKRSHVWKVRMFIVCRIQLGICS